MKYRLVFALPCVALLAALPAACSSSDDNCESTAECGFAVTDHDITSAADCPTECCTYFAANLETVARRRAQYRDLCDTSMCNAVDCKSPPAISCEGGACTAM